MIKKEDIELINLQKIKKNNNISEFYADPGIEHYKLLAYLSTLFNETHIIDIGTHQGTSAKALSYNSSNTIYSFDIVDNVFLENHADNIIFNIHNLFDSNEEFSCKIWEEKILSSPLIFLDIDPHDGRIEYNFYLFLKKNNYQGILILDDIWYFKDMRDNCWFKILTEDKIDITNLGHWSGTGVVQFRADRLNFETFAMSQKKYTNPTLVTAYFDLTKMIDASDEINNRPKQHYLSNAYATLNLDYDMVIYCEEENLEEIKEIRPLRLHSRTKFIVQNFDDFKINDVSFNTYRNKIIDNRIKNHYQFDNRNTASYYLFCISRYLMMLQTMEENIFNNDHFVWINICIERMGFKNLIHLDEALLNLRDKFSTCYIDYVSDKLIQNLPNYFKYGRCSMCSGFFTGNKTYMSIFCNALVDKFIEYLNMGYGHADEQLYSPIYFQNPNIFEFYYGDYTKMITNYRYYYETCYNIHDFLIPKSYDDNNFSITLDACRFLFKSLKKNNNIVFDKKMYELYICSLSMASKENISKEIYEIKNSIKNVAFYTCFIGDYLPNITQLPSNLHDCYYYTNNDEMMDRLENSGWIPIKIDIPFSNDYNTNTANCKILRSSPHLLKELKKYDYICWYDNNLKIDSQKINNLISRMENENKFIVLSKHPYQHADVWGEFHEAMKYERYSVDREKYKNYILHKINECGTDKLDIHYCGGFSIRKNNSLVIKYNEEWQKNIEQCGIEDQISLQFVHPNYTDIIIPIEYKYCWDYA